MGGLVGGAKGGRSKSQKKRRAAANNLKAARKAKKLAAIARARAIASNEQTKKREWKRWHRPCGPTPQETADIRAHLANLALSEERERNLIKAKGRARGKKRAG